MGKSLKAQFKYADRQGFAYVITIGESELATGEYNVKCMADGSVTPIHKNSVTDDVRRIICQR